MDFSPSFTPEGPLRDEAYPKLKENIFVNAMWCKYPTSVAVYPEVAEAHCVPRLSRRQGAMPRRGPPHPAGEPSPAACGALRHSSWHQRAGGTTPLPRVRHCTVFLGCFQGATTSQG